MRVIAGRARGKRLKSPPGRQVRPTPDMAREGLFAMLGERVLGCRFLDLYAGTGAVGIEAVSRGAAEVILVEKDPGIVRLLRQNLSATGMDDQARVIRGDAQRVCKTLSGRGQRFDIVFLDPPYALLDEPAVAAAREALDDRGLLVVQHPSAQAPPTPPGLQLLRTRRYGNNAFSFLAPQAGGRADV